VTLLDSNGTIVYDSPSMALLDGFPHAARYGRPASEYIHPDDWPRLMRTMDALSRGQRASISITARWRNHHGGWRWLESVASSSTSPGATFELTSRDITPHAVRNNRFKAIMDVSRQLAAQGPERFWPALLEAVRRIVPADGGCVLRWDASTRELVLVESTLGDQQAMQRIPAGAGPAGLAVERGAPVVINDSERAARSATSHAPVEGQAVAAVPLQHMGSVLGAIYLVRYASDRPFVTDEIEGLVRLAGIAAGVLVGHGRVRLRDAKPLFDDLRRELTLIVGYLGMLAGENVPVEEQTELTHQALQAAWRGVRHIQRLRSTDNTDQSLTGGGGEHGR
jgi:PAS domain S-box-containing protein